ncbi:hypothetical protein SCP_0310270 [Sparassis crispa]|uniref:Uncharacterized protein n=1 Tax=Sparassis crispa TaxID=139825 RepID=A0A401GGJ2_9APHY|nr:hypothetical protein SCP_0310270 [Sparassis crispa]GBE81300.1 hypothetical protein SCP_0310270 [Sparassis crispa]
MLPWRYFIPQPHSVHNEAIDIQTGDGGVPPTQFTPALDTQLAITPVGTPAEHLDTASSLTVSVSTTFYPTADIDVHSSDLILISTNNVFFHAYRLFRASHNGFGGSLPLSTSSEENEEGFVPMTTLTESADVLNVRPLLPSPLTYSRSLSRPRQMSLPHGSVHCIRNVFSSSITTV